MNRIFLFSLVLCLVSGLAFAQETQSAPAPAPQAAPVAPEGAFSKTVPLKGEDSLSLYVDPGNAMIVLTEKTELTVKVQGLAKEELTRVQVTTKDKLIKVDYRGNKTTLGTFLIELPASFNVDLYASQDVEVKGTLNGSLRIRTNSGTVTVGDVSGSLNVESTAADVYVGNVKGNTNVSTNGDLEIDSVTGDVDLKNRSGDTFVTKIGGSLNARGDDGDISIGDVGGNATVLAGIGDVDLRKVGGVATLNTQGGDIDMFEVVGMVVASSNSGEITLRKVSGAADAKTEDGDITAEMYSGSGGSSKFYTRDGDISVYFPDSAKATVDAKFRLEAGGDAEDAEDVVSSDWPAVNTQKQGGDMLNKYEVNGGGDAVMVETVNGEIAIMKLAPKPGAKTTQN